MQAGRAEAHRALVDRRRRRPRRGQHGAEPGEVVRVDDLGAAAGAVKLALAGSAKLAVDPLDVVCRAGPVDRLYRAAGAVDVECAAAGLPLELYADGHVEHDRRVDGADLDDPLHRNGARAGVG